MKVSIDGLAGVDPRAVPIGGVTALLPDGRVRMA
jgi:hypothetical protein